MLKETLCFVSMLFGHHTCSDEKALTVRCTSRNGVVVCQTHAGNERGKTHISGSVEKGAGAANIHAASTHLDIVATRKGKVIRSVATGFFPATLPETRQGIRGRSTFDVRMGELPPDAEIAVSVHRQPMRLCPYSAKR
ncbi:MAG: hypothetical protein PHQ12_07265 [Chthoniobacteraceae bacterium]|nr:hypothetical protein [Chthoniobacteraceae bacterium]